MALAFCLFNAFKLDAPFQIGKIINTENAKMM